ncbi:MAG: GNAT family N-acetyltransferase [bacterium]|nr:GNAT family N-acetyltransferase [bacterium]
MTKRIVRELKSGEYGEFVDIVSLAYPGMKLSAKKDKENLEKRLKKSVKESEGDVSAVGIFEGEELLGGALYYKFKMNNRKEIIPMAGIGLVAVSLLKKKEHVAKDLLQHFLEYFRGKNYEIASLYAFSPEFYKKMGFCFGTRFFCFKGKPSSFTDYKVKSHLRYAVLKNADKLHRCYDEFARKNHGMFLKKKKSFEKSLKEGAVKYLVYEDGGRIKGYMAFGLKNTWKENFLREQMDVHIMIADEADVIREFSTFLHTQKDQIDRIEVDAYDPDFIHLLSDPRDGSENLRPLVAHQVATDNTAMMYRIINSERFIKRIVMRRGRSNCPSFKLKITDNFLPDNSREIYVLPDKAIISDKGNADITIKIDVMNLSAFLTGVIKLQKLHSYGLIEVLKSGHKRNTDHSLPLEEIDNYLGYSAYPICLTPF